MNNLTSRCCDMKVSGCRNMTSYFAAASLRDASTCRAARNGFSNADEPVTCFDAQGRKCIDRRADVPRHWATHVPLAGVPVAIAGSIVAIGSALQIVKVHSAGTRPRFAIAEWRRGTHMNRNPVRKNFGDRWSVMRLAPSVGSSTLARSSSPAGCACKSPSKPSAPWRVGYRPAIPLWSQVLRWRGADQEGAVAVRFLAS